jgi:hypothetical protein
MAGDWIKIEKVTPRKPEVLIISETLNIHPDHAFGLCFRFWSWCDDNLSNCHAPTVTNVTLDSLIGHTGFASAMQKVGWIEVTDGKVTIPNFERHLSQSAKNRADAAERKRRQRGKESQECHGNSVTKPRPEKRREDSNTPLPPKGDEREGFHLEPVDDITAKPRRKRGLTQTEKHRTKHPEITPTMTRIGGWFGRQPNTLWSIAEVEALQAINPTPQEIDGMEAYYTADIPPEEDHRRTALYTLLNQWSTDLDRARKHYIKTQRASA